MGCLRSYKRVGTELRWAPVCRVPRLARLSVILASGQLQAQRLSQALASPITLTRLRHTVLLSRSQHVSVQGAQPHVSAWLCHLVAVSYWPVITVIFNVSESFFKSLKWANNNFDLVRQ